MKYIIKKIKEEEQELITINCHSIHQEVKEIISFIESLQGSIVGKLDERSYDVNICDILYIESIDGKSFMYTQKEVYQIKEKLYEIEELLEEKSFLRISKSSVVNLMKIKGIKPALNGRFIALLSNGEEIIISRKYVSEFKKKIRGGK